MTILRIVGKAGIKLSVKLKVQRSPSMLGVESASAHRQSLDIVILQNI